MPRVGVFLALCIVATLNWIIVSAHFPNRWNSNRTFYMEDFCAMGRTPMIQLAKNGLKSSGFIFFSRSDIPTLRFLNCSVLILAPTGHGVIVAFRRINIGQVNYNSCVNYVQVLDGMTDQLAISNPICGTDFYEPLEKSYVYNTAFESNSLKILLVRADREPADDENIMFELTFTSFVDGDLENCDTLQMYQCRNKRCISKHLLCDTHNNCGDLSDEIDNGICNSHHSNYVTTASFVGILFAVLILIFVLFFIFMPHTHRFPWVRSPRSQPGRVLSHSVGQSDNRLGIATVSVSVPFDCLQSDIMRQQFRAMGEPPPAYNNQVYSIDNIPPPAYDTVVTHPPFIRLSRLSRSQ